MIEITRITNLFAFGEDATNWTVEELEGSQATNGKRTFAAYQTNLGVDASQYYIVLAANQEAAEVTSIPGGDRRVFMCANNASAEELFGQSILPSAQSYLK